MNFTDFSELLFHTFGRLLLHAQNKHTKFCIKFHFFLFEGQQDILYYCNKSVPQLLISDVPPFCSRFYSYCIETELHNTEE